MRLVKEWLDLYDVGVFYMIITVNVGVVLKILRTCLFLCGCCLGGFEGLQLAWEKG